MTNQDERICQLIQECIQHPDGSREQRQALDRLSKMLLKLPGIYKDNNPRINYQDSLNQAVANLTGTSLKKGTASSSLNIRRFLLSNQFDLQQDNPQEVCLSLLKWFNKIIKRRIYDLYRSLKNQPLSLDNLIDGDDPGTTYIDQLPDLSLNGLDLILSQEELQNNKQEEDKLKRRLESQEVKDKLNNHPQGYNYCTCYELMHRRLLRIPPQKWQDIAKELNVPYGTVTSHWNRKCQCLLDQLKQ